MTQEPGTAAKKVKPEIKDRIIAAAQALVGEGVSNPTNEQVRERMGGGSLTHISPVMREWRESRRAEVASVFEIPGDLRRVIETSLSQVWGAASKLASEAVESVRKDAITSIEAANAERDESLREVSRLEKEVADLQGNLSAMKIDLDKTSTALLHEKDKRASLDSEIASLSARGEDKDRQIGELKAELKEARADNKQLQGELVKIARERNEKGQGK